MTVKDSGYKFENSVETFKGEDEPIIINQELIQHGFKSQIINKKKNDFLEGI